MPSRSERIAALESQLDNSRKRRSQLLGSLGKDSWGAGDADGEDEQAAPHTPLEAAPERGLERSDLSPSPGLSDSTMGAWAPAGADDAALKSPLLPAGSAGGEGPLRAELAQRTRHVGELQAKLAEATRKAEQAGRQVLEGRAALAQLASQKAERDRKIEVLEGAVAEERRTAESFQGRIAELRQHASEHEETARKLRMELHQKTLEFDRIRDESRRQQGEEVLRAKDELLESKAEIIELKSALSALQRKESELSHQLQVQAGALKELHSNEQSLAESLRQSKMQSSEYDLKLEQTKNDLQLRIDKMQQEVTLLSASNNDLRQKEQSLSEALRQCKKQNSEFQLNIDRLQMDKSVLEATYGGLEKQLAQTEHDAEELRSKLHQALLQRDSDEAVIATLRSDLSTLAGLDESLKAAATAETARCNNLQSQLLQVQQQLGHGQDQQVKLEETGKLWQRQLEVLREELQTEQETNRWLRKELEQKTREMLTRAANAREPPEFLSDTTRDMDASLQATERHIALVAKLANQRGAELEQLRQELAIAQDGRRVAEALKTAELEKLRSELNRLKDENRVTEASQITFHMVTESNLEQHKQILAKARFEAATLRSDIANYLHAHKEVMTQVQMSQEAMYIEQLSLQQDLVTCMQEIHKNSEQATEQHAMRAQQANAIHCVRSQCSVIAHELSDILGCDDLSQHAAELGRAMLQHEQVTERLSSVLYASENSRQMLAAKVEQLELNIVDLIEQKETLAGKNHELETALGKCNRQYKFSQSQTESHIACLESAEAKVKQMEEELVRLKKLTEHAEESRQEAEHQCSVLQEQLENSHKEWCMRMLTVQQQIQPLQQELEVTQENRDYLSERIKTLTEELDQMKEEMDEGRKVLDQMGTTAQKSHLELENMRAEQNKLKQMQDEVEVERESLRAEQDKVKEMQEEIDVVRSNLVKERQNLTEEQNQCKLSQQAATQLQASLAQEEERLKKVQVELQKKAEELQEKAEELQEKAEELQRREEQTVAENRTAPTKQDESPAEMTVSGDDVTTPFTDWESASATGAVTNSEQEHALATFVADDGDTREAMTADLQITLDLQYGDAGEEGSAKRATFTQDLISDLASAADVPPAAFAITNISPGSIVVDAQVIPGAGIEPLAVVADLEQQAKAQNSSLRSGKVTSRVMVLTSKVPSNAHGDQSPSIAGGGQLQVQDEAIRALHEQLESYDDRVRTLSQQLSDAQEQTKEVQNLKEMHEMDAKALAESEVLLSQAHAEIQQLARELSDAQRQLRSAQQERRFAFAARDSMIHEHEQIKSDRDGLALALEVKESENDDLSSQLNDALQQLQEIVAWSANDKADMQQKLHDALQKLDAKEASWKQKLEEEHQKTTELMGKLSSDAAQGEGFQSHVQHLEKVSSDLEQLYLQTTEINAMKREIVDKNACLSELETLVTEQFTHSSQEAEILETLLVLSSQLGTCLTSALHRFAENQEDAEKSKLEATKSARAWLAEREERSTLLRAVWELLGREAASPNSLSDLTAEDTADLVREILSDRSIVMEKVASLTNQTYEARQEVEERNRRIQSLLEDALSTEKMLTAQRNRIDELERANHSQMQDYMSWSTTERCKERSQVNESTSEMVGVFERALEETTSLAAEMQGELEENLKAETAAKEEAIRSLAELESSLQAETELKEEAIRSLAELESNLQAEIEAKESAVRSLAELAQEFEASKRAFEESENRAQEQEQTMDREQVLLKAQLDRQQSQREAVEHQLAQACQEIERLENQLAQACQEVERLQEELSTEKAEIIDLKSEIVDQKRELLTLMRQNQQEDLARDSGLGRQDGDVKQQSVQAVHSAASPRSESPPPVSSSETFISPAVTHEEEVHAKESMDAREHSHSCDQNLALTLSSCKEELSAIKASIEEQAVSVQSTIKGLEDRLEKEKAESEALRSELAGARAQNENLRQELDEMRQGDVDSVVVGKVESLETEIAELQKHISALQAKLNEDAECIESLKASEGAATARSAESESKLLEAERTMLACVAEEARLIDEVEAGLNREQELEQRIKMLQGIRDPMHLPRAHVN